MHFFQHARVYNRPSQEENPCFFRGFLAFLEETKKAGIGGSGVTHIDMRVSDFKSQAFAHLGTVKNGIGPSMKFQRVTVRGALWGNLLLRSLCTGLSKVGRRQNTSRGRTRGATRGLNFAFACSVRRSKWGFGGGRSRGSARGLSLSPLKIARAKSNHQSQKSLP